MFVLRRASGYASPVPASISSRCVKWLIAMVGQSSPTDVKASRRSLRLDPVGQPFVDSPPAFLSRSHPSTLGSLRIEQSQCVFGKQAFIRARD